MFQKLDKQQTPNLLPGTYWDGSQSTSAKPLQPQSSRVGQEVEKFNEMNANYFEIIRVRGQAQPPDASYSCWSFKRTYNARHPPSPNFHPILCVVQDSNRTSTSKALSFAANKFGEMSWPLTAGNKNGGSLHRTPSPLAWRHWKGNGNGPS